MNVCDTNQTGRVGERIGHGRERAIEWLRANPEAFGRLAARLREPAAAAAPVLAVAAAAG